MAASAGQRPVSVAPEHRDFLAQMRQRAEGHRDGPTCDGDGVFQGRNSLARRALAQSLGHGRIQVTYSYVPKGV